MKNKLAAIMVGLVVVGTALGVVLTNKDDSKSTNDSSQTTKKPTQKKEISYRGVKDENALTLLKRLHHVETKSYSGLGELVTSINNVAADSKHFWAFYINGEQSQVGANSYVTKDADTITWKLEEIK